MAEKYGVKPKLFTKEWWPYYWMYYKWHTIAIVFIGMVVAIGAVQCARKIEPDLSAVYCGKMSYSEQAWSVVTNALAEDINDINEDGKKNIALMPLLIIDDEQYAEQNYGMQVKHVASFSDETNYIYIYDKEFVDANIVNEDESEVFHITDKWLETDIDDDKLVRGQNGNAYAVSLADSTLMRAAGIKSDEMYLLIKYDTDSPYRNEQAFENAVIAANKLVK